MTTTLRSRDPGPELPGLVETLDSASAQPFDLVALRTGVDGLVRHRQRRRRQVLAGGGALAAALVAGGLTWGLQPGPSTGEVAASPAPTTSAAPPASAEASTTTEPSTVDRTFVPDDVLLTDDEVGAGRRLVSDLGQYADVAVVGGQQCNLGLDGPAPLGGRSVTYYDEIDPGAGSIQLTVSVFAPREGGQALAVVAEDDGRCRWVDEVVPTGAGWSSPVRLSVRGEDVFGGAVVRTVARSGDVLVGVQVTDVRGADQAQADAQRLADLVLERARTSMPAAQD